MGSFRDLWSRSSLEYEKVDESEGILSIEAEQETTSRWHQRYQRLLRTTQLSFALNTVLLLLSAYFYLSDHISIAEASRLVSSYSVFTESNSPNMLDITVSGSLFPPPNPLFSRAEPGNPAAEAIWENNEHQQIVPITREQITRMGKDPSTAVKLPDSIFSLGDDAYAASLDVTHKIHCLNELRKSTFAHYPSMDSQHYFAGTDHDLSYLNETHSKLWWIHLRHCVDNLAQDLMCQASSELMVFNWVDNDAAVANGKDWDAAVPYPDMSINRKCRDWDQLMNWQDEHKIDRDAYIKDLRFDPEGETRLVPNDRMQYELYGFENSVLFPNGDGFEEHFASGEASGR